MHVIYSHWDTPLNTGGVSWLNLVCVCVLLVFQDSVSTLVVFKLSIGSLGVISKDT